MGGSNNATTRSSTNTNSVEVGGAAVGGTGGVSSTLPLEVDNPSGDCGMHYFTSHGTEYAWLPDCQLPIKRHYYRLLLGVDGSTGIYPSLPWADFEAACVDPASPLHTAALHTASCNDGSEWSLSVAEGMTLVHYLNQQLRFSVDANNQVRPDLIYDDDTKDGVDLCLTNAEARNGKLASTCQTLLAWHDVTPPTLTLTQEQATQLAQHLNGLYGVDGALLVNETCTSGSPALKAYHLPECPKCMGGGSPTNACSQLGLRCTYNPCDTCTCAETVTSGTVPTLAWNCAYCPLL
jgi:hypothetical protein